MNDITALEEKLAHLEKTVEDLSQQIITQGAELDRLTKLTTAMVARLREAGDQNSGGVFFGDERPPHY